MEDEETGADTLVNRTSNDVKMLDGSPKCNSTTETNASLESGQPTFNDPGASEEHLEQASDESSTVSEKKINGDCDGNSESVTYKSDAEQTPVDTQSAKCSADDSLSDVNSRESGTDTNSDTVVDQNNFDLTCGDDSKQCNEDSVVETSEDKCILITNSDTVLECKDNPPSDKCVLSVNPDCNTNENKSVIIPETADTNSVCSSDRNELEGDPLVSSKSDVLCEAGKEKTNSQNDQLETLPSIIETPNVKEVPHSEELQTSSGVPDTKVTNISLDHDSSALLSKQDSHIEATNIREYSVIVSRPKQCENVDCLQPTNSPPQMKRKISDGDVIATPSSIGEVSEVNEKFPIQYKGFKKKLIGKSEQIKIDKRISLKGNPFNPSWKKDPKPSKLSSTGSKLSQSVDKGIEVDSSTLQPEYAQYLGLQPIVKFRCSNCGTSSFQSMSALNTHQIECKKFAKVQSPPNMLPQLSDSKLTNIKLTRKVFLCSACGTYYENWNLFLHMREVHRRYICLFCLGMFSVAEKLAEHLMQKHKVVTQNFTAVDEFQKICHPTYFLLCLSCDNVFSETDNFYNHICSNTNTNENASLNNNNKSVSETIILKSTDISSVKPLSPEMKPSTCNNKSTISSKRVIVDWVQKVTNQKESSCKRDFDEDYMCSAASFCHVDIGDSQANPVTGDVTVSELIEKPELVDKAVDKLKTGDSKPDPEIESSSSVTGCSESIQVGAKKEKSIQVENKQPKKTNAVDKINAINKKSLKIPKVPIIKRLMKRKRISPLAKMRDILMKIQNSIGTEEEELEKKVEPIEKENKPDTNITDPTPKTDEVVSSSVEKQDNRQTLEKGMLKMKMQSDMESDGESDDSQKLSMVVDENTSVSDYDSRKFEDEGGSHHTNSSVEDEPNKLPLDNNNDKEESTKEIPAHDEIQLAGDDVAAMALTLDDKINNVKVQAVVKECVRTSCLSCNYCRHAVKIAVNGKQLGLHLLSEHRYTPVKNETSDDVVRKIKSHLDELNKMFFNTETYDSSDPSIHIPYDKDNNFDCFQCNYVTNSHRDLYAHKRKSHTKSLLLCIMCKSNFYSYSELLCHLCPGSYNAEIQFQNADINFRCCFCRLDTIPSAFRLMVHLRKCHHTCDICLEVCLDQQKLSTHMWKHKLNHLCYRCGIAYASKPDITKHLFWKHGTESVLCKKCLQKKWPHVYHFCIPPTSFICEECNTSFSKAVALKVHKRIHAGDFSYACSTCEKRFISKKLLSRHEDRHKNTVENKENNLNKTNDSIDNSTKEDIINVTDIPNENKDQSMDTIDANKDSDVKDKCHKKHKKDKEKEKKSKQVVDVYDLPPLNLSSESDSSDDEELQKKNGNSNDEKNPVPELDKLNSENPSSSLQPDIETKQQENESELKNVNSEVASNDKDSVDSISTPSVDHMDTEKTEGDDTLSSKSIESSENHQPIQEEMTDNTNILPPDESKENHSSVSSDVVDSSVNPELNSNNGSTEINPNSDSVNNDAVEGIWENFYKTNSQNSSLPYPLCAMKSEVAYGIIMGDHDYCQQYRSEPVINEDIPTANIDLNLSDDKVEIEEPAKPSTPVHLQDSSSNLINSMSKKKQKSPKKKTIKGNSSSSSDSSSDSDSSSCSCGTNCSCTSSSSNSSSSSSSDSDSSSTEGRMKQERRRKRKERKVKSKEEAAAEPSNEPPQPEPENELPLEPEDPPIRESELETDETSTDEEFYDRQPQRIANQLLAEKRNQLMLLASVAPVNNGTSSPTPTQMENSTTEQPSISSNPTVKQKQKIRRREGRRKLTAKPRQQTLGHESLPSSLPQREYLGSSTPTTKQYKPTEVKMLPHSDTPGSGSETESMRSSKRRRIPNKFYGYSSGEEEENKPTPIKWRKQDIPVQSPKRQIPPPPPPTPRIQLTVPRQVINRKQIHNPPKPKSDTSSNETDSSDDDDSLPPHPTQRESQKTDVYCYCRCPYDEVSEMIACDDANCKIEWFHFECVGILVPPRGQWYCPECRKRRGLPT